MAKRPDLARRHRERSDQTRRRLLEAARELLEDRPFRSVTIADLTSRAGLTRTAFYRHFADLPALLGALLDDLGSELDAVGEAWEVGADDDPVASLSRALEGRVGLFVEHGRLLRAVVDAAPMHEGVEQQYAALVARLTRSAAERIRADVDAGRSQVGDPDEVARALVGLDERYLLELFGRQPLGDAAQATATLVEIWRRTVYGRD